MIKNISFTKGCIIGITLLCIAAGVIPGICSAEDPNPDEPRPVFQPGDIILVHYPARDGQKLNTFYWSHAALYIGSDFVIEAFGYPGVEIITLDEAVFNHLDGLIDNWALSRVKGSPDVNAVINYAVSKLGQPYDQWSIDHLRKQEAAPSWHPGYGYYCSELVWTSYKVVTGINLDTNHIGLINLWELYTNDQVNVVYTRFEPPNPMVPTGPKNVMVGKTYMYTTPSDADNIYFQWDWDEEPFNPGPWIPFSHDSDLLPLVVRFHTWQAVGTHAVKVRYTDDIFNESHYSEWSPALNVTVTSDTIVDDLSIPHATNSAPIEFS